MVKVVEVRRYQAEDGTLFDDHAAAALHDKKYRLSKLLDQITAYGEIPSDQVVDFIIENAHEIVKILGIRCE